MEKTTRDSIGTDGGEEAENKMNLMPRGIYYLERGKKRGKGREWF